MESSLVQQSIQSGSYVRVYGLPRSMSVHVVKAAFGRFGDIVGIVPQHDATVVCFDKQASALTACASTHGASISGNVVSCQAGAFQQPMQQTMQHQTQLQPASIPLPSQSTFVQTPNVMPSTVLQQPTPNKRYTVCRNFVAGTCSFGDSCRFYHAAGTPNSVKVALPIASPFLTPATTHTPISNPISPSPSAVKSKKTAVCRKFSSGTCMFGDNCRYSHVAASPAVLMQPLVATLTPAKAQKIEQMSVKPTKTKVTEPKKKEDSNKGKRKLEEDLPTPSPSIEVKPCAECSKSQATVSCQECAEGYCQDCDQLAHSSRVMSRHTRVAIQVPKKQCEECKVAEAVVSCDTCNAILCSKCSWDIHAFKILRKHKRVKLSDVPSLTSNASDVPSEKAASSSTSKIVHTISTPVVATPMVEQLGQPVKTTTFTSYSSESSDSEPGEDNVKGTKKKAAASTSQKSVVHPTCVPEMLSKKTETCSSSENESSDDEEDEKEEKEEKEEKKKVPSAKLVSVQADKEISDESSDSSDDEDFEDERPMSAVPLSKPMESKKDDQSLSESESSEDDDSEEEVVNEARPLSTTAEDATSDSGSDSSSDADNCDHAPVRKANGAAKSPAPFLSSQSGTSSHSVVTKITEYANNADMTSVLDLSANLNSFERLLAHDCAEKLGLRHISVGTGLERHLQISKESSVQASTVKSLPMTTKSKKAWSKSKAK